MTLKLNKAQQLGVEFLMSHERAGLFAGLGVGKTITVLKAFSGLRLFGEIRTAMVVAPLRVCNIVWPSEVAQWPDFAHLKSGNLRTEAGWRGWLDQTNDLHFANYEMLPKLVDRMERNPELIPDLFVFDELTKAKNPKSTRINGLRDLLAEHPKVRRWGLTATPSPQGYLDLFAQIRLLDDGQRLGPSFDGYKRMYFHPIDYQEYDWRLNPGAKESIQSRIADLTLTLLSEDYGLRTPIVEEDLLIELPGDARRMYKTMEKELILSTTSKEGDEQVIVSPNAGVLTGKLLQICSGAVYDEERRVVRMHDLKILALKKYLRNWDGPAVIAYNFQHELDRLKSEFPAAEVFAERKTPGEQTHLAERWNAGKVPILLLHPKSAGHGLNLQKGGNLVVWFSPVYSRDEYDQLNGRVARQGQKKDVTVLRLLCADTIDEAVVEVLRGLHDEQHGLLVALRNLRLLRNADPDTE